MGQPYPYKKVLVPAELANYPNGKLPSHVLDDLSGGGELYKYAAVAFNVMRKEAQEAGIHLKNIGDYRPYERQLALFLDRYGIFPTGRVPQITRVWEGRTYFLRQGKSPSATPGTSNHGLGLAIDLDTTDSRVLSWLCYNAPKYGFYLQGPPSYFGRKNPEYEPWHWQYCLGSTFTPLVQKRVLEFVMAGKKK
jgi:LAS superfamily LD-carboxypeptidase LdcB